MVNRLSGTGSWWQVRATVMCRYPGAAGVSVMPAGVLVVVVLPVMLMDALVGKFGADAMIMGLPFGVLGSMIGGTRRMLYLAPAMGVSPRRRPPGGTTARGLHHSDPHRRSGVHATWQPPPQNQCSDYISA